MMQGRGLMAVGLVLGLVAGCGDGHGGSAEARTAARVEALRDDPRALAELLLRMPKGSDLHSHLTGAVATETLIDFGIADDLCIDTTTFVSAPMPCGDGAVPMRDAATDPDLYEDILRAWSLEGFEGPLLARHAHFFATFAKFGAAAGPHVVDIFVEQRREAARQRILYLEIMSSFGAGGVSPVGTDYLPADVVWTPEYLLDRRQAILADPRFGAAVESGVAFLTSTFEAVDEHLACGTPAAEPACAVELFLQVTGSRGNTRAAVFAQWLYGFELAQRVDRVVAVNLVQPEEEPNSLRYYDDDMLAVGTLRQFYAAGDGRRAVRVSLHAGELVPEVLPDTPEGQRQLTFHIRRAVEVGMAERIGHGVDLEHEDESPTQTPETLLQTMRERGVMVEVCLTSNALLLGVSGPTHPLHTYLAHGVPVALSTDDLGPLRTDLTDQYVRAVTVQDLDYRTLKQMSRNGIEYAFAPGASLWRDPGRYRRPAADCAGQRPGNDAPSPRCAAFLDDNLRARLQWNLEREFRAFERSVGG